MNGIVGADPRPDGKSEEGRDGHPEGNELVKEERGGRRKRGQKSEMLSVSLKDSRVDSTESMPAESAKKKRTRREKSIAESEDEDSPSHSEGNTDRNSKSGRWTTEEHRHFLEALELFGKNWKKVQRYVGTRSTTQARSHAQKYFLKMERKAPEDESEEAADSVRKCSTPLPPPEEPKEEESLPPLIEASPPTQNTDPKESSFTEPTVPPPKDCSKKILRPMKFGKREINFAPLPSRLCKNCKRKKMRNHKNECDLFKCLEEERSAPEREKPSATEEVEVPRFTRSFSTSELLPQSTQEIFHVEQGVSGEAELEDFADFEVDHPQPLELDERVGHHWPAGPSEEKGRVAIDFSHVIAQILGRRGEDEAS